MEYPKTPTLDKMKEVKERSQAIGEFLEWLEDTQKYVIAYYPDGQDELCMSRFSTEEMLAKFFNIDLNEAEKEKRAVLEYVRWQNEQREKEHGSRESCIPS